MEYIYPYTIEKQMPELSDIIDCLKKADAKIKQYRDVRPLMAVLSRLESVDTRLASHINKRKIALLATKWDIVPLDDKFVDAAEMVKRRLRRVIHDLRKRHHEYALFGKFLAAIKWELKNWDGVDHGEYWTPTAVNIPSQWDFEAVDEYPKNCGIYTHDPGPIVRNKIADSVEQSFVSNVVRSQHPGGILRAIIFHEWLLNQDIQDWRNFNRRVKGLVVATFDNSKPSDATAEEAAEKAVRQIGAVNYAAVPDSIKFDFLKVVDSVGQTTYKAFKDSLQTDIAIAIRGTANTSELPAHGGSRAAVETLTDIEEDIAFSDREQFAELVNEQLIPQDYARNYSESADIPEIPFEFQWLIKDAEDAEANVRTMQILLDSGVPLYRDEIAKKTGFNPATDDDVIMPKQKPLGLY